jgi:hypothetical protein
MAQFQIEDTNGNSVAVDLVFNVNPFGDNSWSTVSGNPDILGIDQGHWNSDGLQNQLIIRDASDREVATFAINVAVSFTDPFENLSVDGNGDGVLFRGGGIIWTLVSK